MDTEKDTPRYTQTVPFPMGCNLLISIFASWVRGPNNYQRGIFTHKQVLYSLSSKISMVP